MIDSPKPLIPYWTAYGQLEGDTEPMDPLAFDMYAERLGNVLLPGNTGRTQRARYLGMVCAGLQQAGTAARGTEDLTGVRVIRRAFLPFERGWAFCMTLAAEGELKIVRPGSSRPSLRDEYRAFRGVDRALAHYRRTRGAKRLHPNDYRFLAAPEAQGGLGAYLVMLRYGGFVDGETLTVREAGRELARAFLAGLGARTWRLTADRRLRRGDLASVGAALDLGRTTTREAEIIREALLSDDRPLADVCRRVPAGIWNMDRGDAAERAFRGFARANGDPLARAARYALDFDPLRRASLRVFGQFGMTLTERRGSASLPELLGAVEGDLDEMRIGAETLASREPPASLERVSELAARIAGAKSAEESARALLRWHQEHRPSPWIVERTGAVIELRRHGVFDLPVDAFHGYTMGAVLSLLRDLHGAEA